MAGSNSISRVTSAAKRSRSTVRAWPAGTRVRAAVSTSSDPRRRSSSFSSHGALDSLLRLERIAANQFRERCGLVRRRLPCRPHLVKDRASSRASDLPGRFAARQSAADDVDFPWHLLSIIMAPSMSSSAPTAGPITASERILYIDILRGMALFGILAANMRGFNAPESVYGNIKVLFHGRADLIAQGFIDIFIQGKFVTLFSFLFGLGFAVQMSRAEARGAKFMAFLPAPARRTRIVRTDSRNPHLVGRYSAQLRAGGRNAAAVPETIAKDGPVVGGRNFCGAPAGDVGFYIAYVTGLRSTGMEGKPPDMGKIQSVISIYSHGTACADPTREHGCLETIPAHPGIRGLRAISFLAGFVGVEIGNRQTG